MTDSPPKRIGLALGGGVARGLAHIGVLTALDEAGIQVDLVAGSSAGALAGALYSSGLPLKEVVQLAAQLSWFRIARPTWPKSGFISFAPLRQWLVATIGDLSFEDLRLPFTVAVTDLESGQAVYLSSGKLAPAVCASCVIPGFVAAERVNGLLLGDGTLVDAIPVNILQQMGATYVIGVDLFRPKLRRAWGPVGFGFNALEITFRKAGEGLEKANCLISPALAGETYLNFGKAKRLINLGRQAAEEKIPEILSALGV